MTSKLEMAFSLEPTLRGATAEIAAELQERIFREYMATTAPKVLVVGSLDSPAGAMSRSASHKQMVPIGSGTNLESLGMDTLHSPSLGAPPAAAAKRASLVAAATLSVAHLWADAEAALLQATGFASAVSLMELPDSQLVVALWRLVPPMPLASSHPLLIIYTSGTSGYRPRGLVCDTGGYCSGLARTMRLAFDVRPADVVLVDASPSWITGQSYGVAGPLLCRATSIFVPAGELVDDDLPAFLAAGRHLARSNPPSPANHHHHTTHILTRSQWFWSSASRSSRRAPLSSSASHDTSAAWRGFASRSWAIRSALPPRAVSWLKNAQLGCLGGSALTLP